MRLTKISLQALIDSELIIYYSLDLVKKHIHVAYEGNFTRLQFTEEFTFEEAQNLLDTIFTPVLFIARNNTLENRAYCYCSPKYIKGVFKESDGNSFMFLKATYEVGYRMVLVDDRSYQRLAENNCYKNLPYLSKQVFDSEALQGVLS